LSGVLDFIYTPVSWVLLQWHHLFSAIGLDKNSGLNWALSIVFLVITARLLLFRVFLKQVKYQRQMAVLQPEIKKIQQKYKDDRQAQQQAMMKFQQEHGFNPLAGCLPLFLQMPIFLGLFHVLRHMSNSLTACDSWGWPNPAPGSVPSGQLSLYTFTPDETCSAANAKLFGGAPLAAWLRIPAEKLASMGGERGVTVITIVVLVLISAVATFSTQKLARMGNPVQPEGQAAMIANLMQYLIPLGTLFSGLFFPLGVLLYWFTSNTWTMGQQLYVNKFHPHEASTGPTYATGKALAPKPGAKPVRPGATATVIDVPAEDGDESANSDATVDPVKPTTPQTPRPGQRPSRPSGGPRKPANQRKKRR
jgi:YidC/Oxa1 family membrane protein insertase